MQNNQFIVVVVVVHKYGFDLYYIGLLTLVALLQFAACVETVPQFDTNWYILEATVSLMSQAPTCNYH